MKATFAGKTFASGTFASGTWAGIGVPLEPEPAICGTDMMETGMGWLTNMLQAHMSKPVVYERDAAMIALCATFGQTKLMLANDMGAVRIEWTDRDFLIPTASLVIGGVPTLPKRGDIIRHKEAGQVHTFQVLPFGNEPHWKWCDPYRKMLRIHTKRIKTEAIV